MFTIANATDTQLDTIFALYKTSFPRDEVEPEEHLRSIIKSGALKAFYAQNDGEFAGFALVFPLGRISLLAFLAVPDNIRGGGTGTKILDFFKQEYAGKTLTIEIEDTEQPASNSAMRMRRRGFYLRNGYVTTGFKSMLYGTRLEIMCIGDPITPEEYIALQEKLLSTKSYAHMRIAD